MSEPRPPRESLTSILAIEARRSGAAVARLESFWGAAVPGDLLARAALTATLGRETTASALYATFLSSAPADVDLDFALEALAPDRSRVRIRRGEELLCEVALRFGPVGGGLTYQCVVPEPDLPAPEDLPSEAELAASEGWSQYAVGPIEARRIGVQAPVDDNEPAVWVGWLKPREALPNDARLHAAALVFLSEYRSHWAVERRLGADFPKTQVKLLDHALWIHRAEPWDDWWLVKTLTDIGVAGRCLSRREIFNRAGALVASATWEAVARRRDA